MKLCITGSLAFDYIMDYPGRFSDNIMPDKIHKINLSFLISDLKKQNGGTAGNIAYNLALLKYKPTIFACAGKDIAEYSQFLEKSGVDCSEIKISDKPTASAYIMTDKDDNQITAFYPGAMSDSGKYSITDLKITPDFVVISPNSPQAIIKLSRECQQLKIPFMLDIGMQLPSLESNQIKQILHGADILIGNDYEIELLKEKSGFSEKNLLEVANILITTLGPKGSNVKTKSDSLDIKAGKPKKVLDPTGAGDAYRAGFLAGYFKKLDLKVCAQMGSAASCFTIEKYGTTSHRFSLEEFKKRYRENFKTDLKL